MFDDFDLYDKVLESFFFHHLSFLHRILKSKKWRVYGGYWDHGLMIIESDWWLW